MGLTSTKCCTRNRQHSSKLLKMPTILLVKVEPQLPARLCALRPSVLGRRFYQSYSQPAAQVNRFDFPWGGCTKTSLKLLTLFALLSMALMLNASSVTVVSMDGGNCYQFMCNDSGTSVGQSTDYQ